MITKPLKSTRLLLFTIIAFFPIFAKAQYTQVIAGPSITPAVSYIYVGSLTLDPANSANCQKLRVSVLGGTWFSNSIGETVYYIANRGGLSVNQVSNGGAGQTSTTLRAFQNGTNTDLYLQISYTTAYYAMGVWSYNMAGYNATAQNVAITTSATTPAGTDITSTIAYIPLMTTDASGNIAINSVSANGYKLAVKGNIHAQQVNVDLAGWSDYVFNKDYQLPKLAEVKSYIDINHHLPDVPSEQQVLNKGLDIGEINKLIVKKVEELTLYLIEKDNQINRQQKEIDELKREMRAVRKNPKQKSYHQAIN